MERNRGELQEDEDRTRKEKEGRDRKTVRHGDGERKGRAGRGRAQAGRREGSQDTGGTQNRTGRQNGEATNPLEMPPETWMGRLSKARGALPAEAGAKLCPRTPHQGAED